LFGLAYKEAGIRAVQQLFSLAKKYCLFRHKWRPQ